MKSRSLRQERLNYTFEMTLQMASFGTGEWALAFDETNASSGLRSCHLPDGSVVPRKHYQQPAAQYPDVDGEDKTVNTDNIGNQRQSRRRQTLVPETA